MIKSSCESNNIRSNIHLILLVPGAGEQLLGGDGLEDGQVQEGQLASQILCRYIYKIKGIIHRYEMLMKIQILSSRLVQCSKISQKFRVC